MAVETVCLPAISVQQSENETQNESTNPQTPISDADGTSENTDSLTEQAMPDEKAPEEAVDQNQYEAHAANKIMTFDADSNKLFEHCCR